MGRLEGKKPPGKPSRRWEDNIKMYIQKAGLKGIDCIDRS
jgi:hypothetical protein